MKRHLRCVSPLLALTLTAGCTSSPPPVADAGPIADTGSVTDEGPVDVPRDAIALPDRPASLPCPIEGAGPRSYHLRGAAIIYRDAGGSQSIPYELDLYLPQGRVAGAPIHLAFPTYWPESALTVVEGRFGADLGATGLDWTAIYGGVLSFRGRMAAPSGGLELDLTGNLNGATDVPEFADGRVSPCPTGDAPAPTLRSSRMVPPSGRVELVPSAPVGSGLDTVRLRVAGAPVATDAFESAGMVVVTPRAWLPPSTAVTLDLGSLRDVMGRPFSLEGAITSLATTAVVTDREFDAAPPAAAVATERPLTSADGALRHQPSGRGPYRVLVALGALSAGTTLTARMTVTCNPTEFSVWVVAADGAHTELPLGPAMTAPQDLRGALPGAGPTWLLLENRAVRSRPGWGVPLGDCGFALDRVAVE
jgi:hypothetical protein